MDTIQPNARVVIDYTLSDDDGDTLDASDVEDGAPIVYVHGYGMLVPGLEKALVGLRAGEEKTVVVPPEEGFGERDPDLVIEVDRSELPRPESVVVGDELVAESPDGDEVTMHVAFVGDDGVVLDANHPLAGENLHYLIRVREVRSATEEELREAAAHFDEAGYAEPDKDGSSLVALRKK